MADQPVMYMCSKCSQLYSDLEEFKTHECVTGDEVYLPEGEGEGVDSGLVDQQQYDEGQQYQTDMGELEAQPPEELMGQIEGTDQQMQDASQLTEQDTTAYTEQPSEAMEQDQPFWTEEMVSLKLETIKKNLGEGKFGTKLWQCVSEEIIQVTGVAGDQVNPTGVKEKWTELMREYIQSRSANQAHLLPFANELEYFYDNHRQVYIDIERGQTSRSPFWTQAKTLDLVRIMSREKSKFGNDLRGRNALYTQVAGILSKQYGAPVTPQQIKGKYNRICQSYQKTTGNRIETEDSSFFDNLLSFIVEEGGMEEEHGEDDATEDGKLTEPEPSGDEEYKPPKKPVKTMTKPLTRPAAQAQTPQKKPMKAKWSLELAKVLITIVKEHHKLLETGATSEAQFFEHCSKWLKERATAEIDGPTLQTKYNRMRSEFDTYLMRQGEKPKEMPMSTYLSRMEAKLKEHVETPRSKVASAPTTPAAPSTSAATPSTSDDGGFLWDDKSTRMFLRILRHFTKAVEANEITIDQVCKDAADILQSYVKLNVTGDQCRRRWQILTAKHRDTAKGGAGKPGFAKSLSILEKTFGIEKMEEGEKGNAVTDEMKEEETATTDLLKNRPGITLSKVAPPKEPAGGASGSGCTNCGKFDKVLSTLLKDEREMRKKEHESLLKVIKDQSDAMNSFKAAIAALTKVCQHISSAQDNISKQLPKLVGGAGKRIRDDDTAENRNARRRRTGD